MPYPNSDEDDWPPEPNGDGLEPLREWPSLEVEMTDPEVTGQLFSVDGSVLLTVYGRSVVPFGFQVPR